MNDLEARIECLKLAVAISGTDKTVNTLVTNANALYHGVVEEASGDTAPPPSSKRNIGASSTNSERKDKAKAP